VVKADTLPSTSLLVTQLYLWPLASVRSTAIDNSLAVYLRSGTTTQSKTSDLVDYQCKDLSPGNLLKSLEKERDKSSAHSMTGRSLNLPIKPESGPSL
jgi:hypothetical protein